MGPLLFLCPFDTSKWALYGWRDRFVSRASGHPLVRGVGMCLEESGWDRSFLCTYSIQEAVVPLMPGALNPLRMGIRSETAEAVQPGLNDL